MDDLDHSMHIADYDWLSFYEESEECCLLQPSLACPDNSTLSDSEGLDSSIYTCTDCTQPPVQLDRRPSDNHQAEEDSALPQDTEVLQKGLSAIQCLDEGAAQLESKVGQQPADSDLKAEQEPELPTSEGGVCDYVSSAGSRAEKERWFVTLNINPEHWAPGTWVKKKKRRQKNWKKDATHKLQSDMCFDHDITNQVKKESVRASDTDSIQCHQDKYSECAEIRLESSQIELITDSNMCLTKSLCKYPYSTRESISKTTMDTNKPNDDLSFITDASLSDTGESEEFAEADFFSSCSYDSENYVSATESVEEPQHLSMQNAHLNLSENVNADSSVDGGMHFSDSSLFSSAVTINCHERMGSRAHVEPSQTFLFPHHRADNMPNENYSTWSNGTESTALCVSSDTPISELNSAGPEKDQIESLPQPVAVTADSPEAYARVIGNTQSVYAISAFWDEMEKLTINDILHLKMGRSMLPGETCSADKLVGSTGNVAGASDNSSVVSSMDCNLADSMGLDMSDTADSDYFTHIDESKPDCSSCDFSTSNFKEEYWQFFNSSRNSSPDHQDKSPQSHRTGYSSFSTYEEDSDEMGTPVPSKDCSWPHDSTFSLCDLTSPQHLRKNKSMYNVHALNSLEDLTRSVDQSCCRPLEESVSMKTSDSFNISTCAPIMCYTDEQYQISFPRVFEYLFTDKEKYEVMSVTLYGLREIPKSPAHDYTFCAVDSDLPLISFCDSECSEEPIPIFSCTHPTVRELTFPKPGYIFLGTNRMTLEDVSPIRVVSQSLIRNFNCKRTDRSYWFSQDLSSLFSIKKFCFHDKGCDAWTYQVEAEKKPVNAIDSHFGVVTEGGASSVTSKLLRDTAVRQITDTQTSTNPQSIFSTIKQSDMCLVCIAFASWVLKSSDPEAADAWKAALLANVSALSAIQYLRQYMKKKAHPQDDQ